MTILGSNELRFHKGLSISEFLAFLKLFLHVSLNRSMANMTVANTLCPPRSSLNQKD